ncbi:hypothetical protein GUITHDRAFT_155653 [Guillardia theta CCMP2712]|uniref:Uncharacterized protein n=2 Tax=Guillardia theta TaxID=55529 RepID=L1IEI1_GUITC|nr:hypothetical protein GUITHDRAFT_155653 [Guillardia theta CCMP2712]EKX34681.1 hypothetical protein GUITHDRAFT_155653 [Guillardia theta CCMP2712]|mmetsp:Transcript_49927/g.156268  ORF Transcript_49927/g.156268 Transcript_49927/m.156268 type:complete len:252 (+) Transcript_49927:47-802(+)|eukprot:XP_005821661.1 hypothetical protein GUITHDRAFT_155653 [Guillardia theta CCMP2712]
MAKFVTSLNISLPGSRFSVLDTAKVASLLVKPTVVRPAFAQGKLEGEATESHKEAVDALLFLSSSRSTGMKMEIASDINESRKRKSAQDMSIQAQPNCNLALDAARGGKKAKTLEQEFVLTSQSPTIPRGSYKCSRCGKPKKGHRCNLPDSEKHTVFKQAQQPSKWAKETQKASVAVLPAHSFAQAPGMSQVAAKFSACGKLQNVDPNLCVPDESLTCKKPSKTGPFSSQVACALFLAGCSSISARNSQFK